MQFLESNGTVAAPREIFTGDVWFDVLANVAGEDRLRVNMVRFSPGARTAWHTHPLGQTLHVTEGLAVVATRDAVEIVRPGQSLWCPEGEEHWHGAVSDRFMQHLAMWEGDGVVWGDKVTDDEYAAALATPNA